MLPGQCREVRNTENIPGLKEIKQTWLLNGLDSVKGVIGTFGKYGLEGTLDKSIVKVLNFINVMVLRLRGCYFSFLKIVFEFS